MLVLSAHANHLTREALRLMLKARAAQHKPFHEFLKGEEILLVLAARAGQAFPKSPWRGDTLLLSACYGRGAPRCYCCHFCRGCCLHTPASGSSLQTWAPFSTMHEGQESAIYNLVHVYHAVER